MLSSFVSFCPFLFTDHHVILDIKEPLKLLCVPSEVKLCCCQYCCTYYCSIDFFFLALGLSITLQSKVMHEHARYNSCQI
uniref:Uncharacterized protein n=1 Tax=Pyxicephalus adspersus TaxID=30357 RepID=A0AAV3AT21_PYXAD|nr:TPA: hypothetical protein GDO54_006915 [Pyxicephalus adspersus]